MTAIELLSEARVQRVSLDDSKELDDRMGHRIGGVIRGHPYARAAFDIAVWGRLARQPVYNLLGGAVRTRIEFAHMLGLVPPDEAPVAAADGVRSFQVKLRGDLASDVEVLGAVRDPVGPGARIRADIDQGLAGRPLREAITAVRAIADAGADLGKHAGEEIEAMAAPRAAVDVPIDAHESCWTSADAAGIGRAGAAAIAGYVAKSGRLKRAYGAAAIAGACGRLCDVNGSLESGVGTLASVHLAASAEAISLQAVSCTPVPAGTESRRHAGLYYEDDALTGPVEFEEGYSIAPPTPGISIRVDERKVQAITIQRAG